MQIMDCRAPGFGVEVDQNVAAKDYIKRRFIGEELGLRQISPFELDSFMQFIPDPP